MVIWSSMLSISAELTLPSVEGMAWIGALFAIACLAPNTQQIFSRTEAERLFSWNPTALWATALGIAFGVVLSQMITEPTAFLYFRF
jgi:hypothetical protein